MAEYERISLDLEVLRLLHTVAIAPRVAKGIGRNQSRKKAAMPHPGGSGSLTESRFGRMMDTRT
jgi:hypothetical protein